MRIFIPSKPSTVKQWTWTKGHGLKVEYLNGLKAKSEWSLRELLNADHTHGDGLPTIEIFSKEQDDGKRSLL